MEAWELVTLVAVGTLLGLFVYMNVKIKGRGNDEEND